MSKYTTFVGMDIHKKTISIAIADDKGVRKFGTINNDWDAIGAFLRKIPAYEELSMCYEAGPCGYTLYRYLRARKIKCIVVAPSLIPRKPGDRVKTDSRDAVMLVKLLKAGELTPCWVPDEEDEALRDLVRTREDAVECQRVCRQQLRGFLDRNKLVPRDNSTAWSTPFMSWLNSLKLLNATQQAALSDYIMAVVQAVDRVNRLSQQVNERAKSHPKWEVIHALTGLKGVDILTATTLVTEVGEFSRFPSPTGLMSYAGVVPSESSSGSKTCRGRITKAGNAHIRRVLGQAAWQYAALPKIGPALSQRRKELAPEVIAIADKALRRLNQRYFRLMSRSKMKNVIATALARELLGFIWAIAVVTEKRMGSCAA